MTKKQRLDQRLVDLGWTESRSKAQALIRAGEVFVDGQRRDKPGMPVALEAQIHVRERPAWVGRGGHKLDFALTRFGLSPEGLACLDVGASTGGFTDVLLARGASLVHAVDVGRAQLAWTLRQDPRVNNLERTDIRTLEILEPTPMMAAIDVAFISLRAVLPAVGALCAPGAPVVALVKPQFEAGRRDVGRGGIVRDETVHRRVLVEVMETALEADWSLVAAAPSPILGGEGNREFLLHMRSPGAADRGPTDGGSATVRDGLVDDMVADATAPATPKGATGAG